MSPRVCAAGRIASSISAGELREAVLEPFRGGEQRRHLRGLELHVDRVADAEERGDEDQLLRAGNRGKLAAPELRHATRADRTRVGPLELHAHLAQMAACPRTSGRGGTRLIRDGRMASHGGQAVLDDRVRFAATVLFVELRADTERSGLDLPDRIRRLLHRRALLICVPIIRPLLRRPFYRYP